jgi:TPR repeat protein
MGRIEKTVFISYRRTDEAWAIAVFVDLTHNGYDVFIDYDGIASGNFETAILENIKARAHFLVLLTPTALERCGDPKDWMRREIEAALDSQRNIVPLMLAGFGFGASATANQLTGKLAALKQYNGLPIPTGFFSEAMGRLRSKFLNVPVDAVLHPASASAQQVAKEQKDKATMSMRKLPEPPQGEARQPGGDATQKAEVEAQRLEVEAKRRVEEGKGQEQAAVETQQRAGKRAAAKVDAEAIRNLGEAYEGGRGVAQDYAKARKWFEKAVAKGNPDAMVELGTLLREGWGVEQDQAKAIEWYEKAAATGDATAMTFLGDAYDQGRGVAQDFAKAREWLEKAVAKGDTNAMIQISAAYYEGRGVARDYAKACEWLEKAADKGNPAAPSYLSTLYRGDSGVPKDDAKAAKWQEKVNEVHDKLALRDDNFRYQQLRRRGRN